jgi:hypothetical protein
MHPVKKRAPARAIAANVPENRAQKVTVVRRYFIA